MYSRCTSWKSAFSSFPMMYRTASTSVTFVGFRLFKVNDLNRLEFVFVTVTCSISLLLQDFYEVVGFGVSDSQDAAIYVKARLASQTPAKPAHTSQWPSDSSNAPLLKSNAAGIHMALTRPPTIANRSSSFVVVIFPDILGYF